MNYRFCRQLKEFDHQNEQILSYEHLNCLISKHETFVNFKGLTVYENIDCEIINSVY